MRNNTFARRCAALIVLAVLGALPQQLIADTVFSQPPVDDTSAYSSDTNLANQQIADNFSLPAATSITSIRWWGVYASTPPASSDFIVRFFADSGGVPVVAPFDQQTVTGVVPVPTALEPDNFNPGTLVHEFSATLPIPVALLGGVTYHLGFLENSAATHWAWAGDGAGAFSVRSGEGNAWQSSPLGNRAFELNDANVAQVVPLPAAAWAGMALIGSLGAVRAARVVRPKPDA